jgi:hypothetical protein
MCKEIHEFSNLHNLWVKLSLGAESGPMYDKHNTTLWIMKADLEAASLIGLPL